MNSIERRLRAEEVVRAFRWRNANSSSIYSEQGKTFEVRDSLEADSGTPNTGKRGRSSRFRITACIFAIACAVTGCAGMSAGVVQNDSDERGYRYYGQVPFLFVRSDGKGALTSEVVYLADDRKKLSVRPYAILAANNATLSFSNGMLTEASAVIDETALPIGILDSLSKAASAAIAADLPSDSGAAPVPYLFRITVKGDSNTIELDGGPALELDAKTKATIHVVVVTPTGK